MIKTGEDIKIKLLEKIKELEAEISKYNQALKIIEEFETPTPQKIKLKEPLTQSEELFPETVNKKPTRRMFLFEIVESILKNENRPLSSRDLMNKANEYNKNNKYDFNKNWSGTFSQAYRKPNSKIKQIRIENVPAELTAYYGLTSWFVDGELIPEYRQKIKSHYNV